MSVKKEFGKRLKQLRIKKGYTQENLSELADISQRALSKIEIGENFLTAETLEKLLRALDITLEDMFATNSHKEADDLIKMINYNIAKIGKDSKKLEIIYNLTKSLCRN